MRKTVYLLVVSLCVMLILPWLAVALGKDGCGMVISFLLFFAVDPVFSIVVGIYAGQDAKARWAVPVLSAVFFLVGTWLFFDPGELTFVLYAFAYLLLGMASMFIAACIKAKRNKQLS